MLDTEFSFDEAFTQAEAAGEIPQLDEKGDVKAVPAKRDDSKIPSTPANARYEFEAEEEAEEASPEAATPESEGEDVDEKGAEGGKEGGEAEKKPLVGKKLKAKVGDDVLEVPVSAVFKHKVDGEEVEIPLNELLDGYASRAANHKQYRQTEVLKEEVTKTKGELSSLVNTFSEQLEANNVTGAVLTLLKTRGGNPLPLLNQLREGLVNEAEALIAMGAEGRKQLYAQEHTQYLEQELQKVEDDRKSQTRRIELAARVDNVVTKYGMGSRDAFFEILPEVEAYARKKIESGEIDKKTDLTPEVVGQYFEARQQQQLLDTVLREEAPQVTEDSEDYQKFAKLVVSFKPTKAQLKEIVSDYYGTSGAEATKPGRRSPGKEDTQKKDRSTKEASGEAGKADSELSFDGIEPLDSF